MVSQSEEAYIEDVMAYLAWKIQNDEVTKKEFDLYESYQWQGAKAIFANKKIWKKIKKEYESQ